MSSKHRFISAINALAVSALIFASCSRDESVCLNWTEGDTSDGVTSYTITIQNARRLPRAWEIWFSQLPVEVTVSDDSQCEIEHIQANTYRIVPKDLERRDSLVVHYLSLPLKRNSWAPEGFTLRAGERCSELKTVYSFRQGKSDAETAYVKNALRNFCEPALTDIIPAPKSVTLLNGKSLIQEDALRYIEVEGKIDGWYRISVCGEASSIEYSGKAGRLYAKQTLSQLLSRSDGQLPNMVIEDYPDLQYRGLMIDVARNFTSKRDMLRLIDLAARYKVNYLHLHLSDDEGWRLEVNGIPELTSFGAYHALPVLEDGKWVERTALQPSYDGNADINSAKLSNGFYSREDYKEIISYAWACGIQVIPEFDMPAHSRAAIKSVLAYERRTGDSSLRLQDPSDSSVYTSAQGYTDNVISVKLPSVYKFIATLFDELIEVYEEASVPLPCIHIGGDEVAQGAWEGEDLRDYFVSRVLEIACERGVRLAGWQEIAGGLSFETAKRLKESLFGVNCWNCVPSWGTGELPYALADKGYPVILSNVKNTYADQAYSSSRYEIGHSWAGYLDAEDSFSLLPFDLANSERGARSLFDSHARPMQETNIKGVQAQLFSETVRSFDDVTYDLLPKIVGVFERGWNAYPSWRSEEEFRAAFDRYYSIIVQYEMPWWASQGFNFHLPQAGVRRTEDGILTNVAFPQADAELIEGVGVRAEYLGRKSVPSVL